ncbi:TadE/TadG family type IV pilus assembly protein [Amphritea sp. HPY]|uniref:TadE/TadG family type IV pilus assembly protein n=1 Tax=Amphritea sp. HPY TaxID=3421652 RepID=UPI003D7C45BD
MNTLRHKHQNRQQGVAIIEFTITLPLLLLLLFAGAEVGRLLYQYNTLTKSVEDGARFLAGHVRMANSNGTLATVTSDAVKLVQYGSTLDSQPYLLPGTVTVTTQTAAADPNPIIVTATYTYDPMIFPNSIPGFGLWNDILLARPLTASVEMPIL